MTNFFGGVLWEHIEGELLVVLRNYQFTKKVIKVFVRKKMENLPPFQHLKTYRIAHLKTLKSLLMVNSPSLSQPNLLCISRRFHGHFISPTQEN